MLLPTGGYQAGHNGTGGLGWNPPSGGTNVSPPRQRNIDYRALAQELATAGNAVSDAYDRNYDPAMRSEFDQMFAALAHAKAAGLEVP